MQTTRTLYPEHWTRNKKKHHNELIRDLVLCNLTRIVHQVQATDCEHESGDWRVRSLSFWKKLAATTLSWSVEEIESALSLKEFKNRKAGTSEWPNLFRCPKTIEERFFGNLNRLFTLTKTTFFGYLNSLFSSTKTTFFGNLNGRHSFSEISDHFSNQKKFSKPTKYFDKSSRRWRCCLKLLKDCFLWSDRIDQCIKVSVIALRPYF